MIRSSLLLGCFLGLAGLLACSKAAEEIETGSGAATEGDGREAIKVGNITLSKVSVTKKVKASSEPDEFRPEFDSCEVDANFWQIAGTGHDAEINKVLRGDFVEPEQGKCEFPEIFGQEATLRGIDPEQGLLSVVEFESFDQGGVHPMNGSQFKMIDLRSGKLLSLADYVKPDATPKLNELVKQKIMTQRVKMPVDQPRNDRGGRSLKFEVKLLPPEDQDMMKGFADSYFTTITDKGEDRPLAPSEITDFTIAGTGIRIDLSNQLPHALGGMDASYKLTWRDLEGAGVLRTDTDLIERTKKARAKQPR
jgi:hypothetical protein